MKLSLVLSQRIRVRLWQDPGAPDHVFQTYVENSEHSKYGSGFYVQRRS